MKFVAPVALAFLVFASVLSFAVGCADEGDDDTADDRGGGIRAGDDAAGDDSGDDAGDDDLFPPEAQVPFIEKGFILPPDSLECIPQDTGVPRMNCNHHGSTVAELPDGTIAAVWYHGVNEGSPDARIVWSRIAPGAADWTWPEVLFDDPDHSEGNPALWVAEDGRLTVFFVSIMGDGWDQSEMRLVRSADGGETWTPPVTLRERWCWMTRHRPVRLEGGGLLLPLYNECLAMPVFMRSSDEFSTWTEEGHASPSYLLDHAGQIQPALVTLDGGRLAAITRDGFPSRRIKRMTSDDLGKTWTRSEPTALPNSGTSVDQTRLLDGHVVVIFNDDPHARFPLSAALSVDGGETFVAKKDLNDECDGASCSYAYPSVVQSTHDGTIWVTYSHERDTIGWVHFNEAWVME